MKRLSPDIRVLREFLAVAHERSLRRAAARLDTGQPLLSQRMAALEAAIGTPLFVRSSRGVALTEAGRTLVPRAERLVRGLEAAVEEIRGVARGETGALHVAAVPTLATGAVVDAFQALRLERPRLVLNLRETPDYRSALALLDSGQIQAALVRGPVSHTGARIRRLLEEDFVAVLPRRHRLARRDAIALADLRDEPFILFDVDAETALHAAVVNACVDAGFIPTIACAGAELMTIGRLVSTGVGVALVPRTTAKLLEELGIVGVSLATASPRSEILSVTAADLDTPPALEAFLVKVAQALSTPL